MCLFMLHKPTMYVAITQNQNILQNGWYIFHLSKAKISLLIYSDPARKQQKISTYHLSPAREGLKRRKITYLLIWIKVVFCMFFLTCFFKWFIFSCSYGTQQARRGFVNPWFTITTEIHMQLSLYMTLPKCPPSRLACFSNI